MKVTKNYGKTIRIQHRAYNNTSKIEGLQLVSEYALLLILFKKGNQLRREINPVSENIDDSKNYGGAKRFFSKITKGF